MLTHARVRDLVLWLVPVLALVLGLALVGVGLLLLLLLVGGWWPLVVAVVAFTAAWRLFRFWWDFGWFGVNSRGIGV